MELLLRSRPAGCLEFLLTRCDLVAQPLNEDIDFP